MTISLPTSPPPRASLTAEELVDSPLGEAMVKALVLHGVAARSARALLVAATRVVDEFVAQVEVRPTPALLAERLGHDAQQWRGQHLERPLSCVLPVLELVRKRS